MLVAALALAGVVYFASIVLGEKSSYAARVGSADQALAQAAAQARMHALVQDSVPERTRLEGLLGVGLLTAADAVEFAGKSAGVKLEVSDAAPEGTIVFPGKSAPLYAVGFVVGADGTFSALIRALELLQALPLPTTLESLDISRTPIGTGADVARVPWHLNARVRLLTSTKISI